MEGDHAGGRGVAGVVGVEAAVEVVAAGKQASGARGDWRERRRWRCRCAADASGSN